MQNKEIRRFILHYNKISLKLSRSLSLYQEKLRDEVTTPNPNPYETKLIMHRSTQQKQTVASEAKKMKTLLMLLKSFQRALVSLSCFQGFLLLNCSNLSQLKKDLTYAFYLIPLLLHHICYLLRMVGFCIFFVLEWLLQCLQTYKLVYYC